MILEFKYTYLLLNVPFLLLWVILFAISKKTRKEQLIMSVLLLPLGTISEILYFQDYWNPASILSFNIGGVRILLEDFLFCFSIAGIGAIIYEVIFKKKLIESKAKTLISAKIALFLTLAIGATVSYSLFASGMNSIFATSIGFLITALFIISLREDLLFNSFISGLAVMVIMFVVYFIGFRLVISAEEILQRIWFLHGTPQGLRILRVPMTEMVWGFSWGMFLGPLYEFLKKMRLR